MTVVRVLGALLLVLSASTGRAATFTVNAVIDPGSGGCNVAECTLREAIAAANAAAGPDDIAFALAGAGPHTIAVASSLPMITEALVIDGYTQAGSSQNTQASGALDTVIQVELTRVSALGTGTGLNIGADDVTVRGLAIGGFQNGVLIGTQQDVAVGGNFIGMNAQGNFSVANATAGVFVSAEAQNVTVGGALPEDRNLISGSDTGPNSSGVIVASSGATPTSAVVSNNLIGTDLTGLVAIPNTIGIRVATGNGGVVDSVAIEFNVIAGNDSHGINVVKSGATSEPFGNQNVIDSNTIGVAVDGNPLGNLGNGIWFSNISRTRWVVSNNLIAFNGLAGVQVNAQVAPATGVGDTITMNSIHSNGGIGIDLDGLGVSANDTDDPDGGGNSRQNFPILDEAFTDGSATGVFGLLNSTPASNYILEFFDNEPTDVPDTEGRTFLGTTGVLTGGPGVLTPFTALLPAVAPGRLLTATATDDQGNTSEFSAAIVVQITTTTTIASTSTTSITTTSTLATSTTSTTATTTSTSTTVPPSTTSTTVAPTTTSTSVPPSTTSTTVAPTTTSTSVPPSTTSTTVAPTTTSTTVPPSTTSTTVAPTTTSTSVPPTTTSTSTSTSTTISPLCGNGSIDPGEECDTTDFGTATCPGSSVIGAFLVCNANCTIDFSGCPVVTTTSTTVPSTTSTTAPSTTSTTVVSTTSTTVASTTSTSVPSTTSTSVAPTTTTTSSSTSTTISPLCGNGSIDPGEECDTTDFGTATCPGSSVIGAFLVCNVNCTIDFSGCPPVTTTSTTVPSTTSTTAPSTTSTTLVSTTSTTLASTTSTTLVSTTSTTLASTTSTTVASTTSTTAPSTTSTTLATTTSTTVPPSTTSTTVLGTTTSTTTTSSTSTSSSSSSTSSSSSSSTLASTTSTTTLPSTTSTSTTTSTSSTTSTTIAGLVPGGKKTNSDCYLEMAVQGVENDGVQVVDNKTVLCTDGTACDADGQCDNVCTFQIAACINQNDPNLPDCTPPAGLDSVKIKGKVTIQVPQLLEGSVCGAFLDAPVEAKFNKKGAYLPKKSKLKLKGKAKAPKGTQPRTDSDQFIFQCVPNDNCP